MSNFIISFEDAKKILSVFYNSPYRNVVGFVDILHAIKEEGTELSLKEKIDIENAIYASDAAQQNSNE